MTMAHETRRQAETISRRAFCRTALAAALTAHCVKPSARAGEAKRAVKFFKNLAPGHIGVKANQQQALEYAVQF
jgi:hypothetical protein